MSHKVHQKVFRIKEVGDWDSRGFYGKNTPQKLEEDFKIREFLKKKLGNIGIERIEIERFPGKTKVIVSTLRPGLIIGRGGKGVEKLKEELNKKVLKKGKKEELKLDIREVKDPWSSATLTAQWIGQQIEKRMPYRRVLKQAISKMFSAKGVRGCRVQVTGRLNGIEIARSEWLQKGQLPRQTIRADIDYALGKAFCTYGVIGIKVWIYKGEKF